ncbi:MAG: FAD-dependent oxidoreductase [Chloroflexota bacterium]|nr:FAD-dependent oxidoreductase [Chloroflexota bacterium]
MPDITTDANITVYGAPWCPDCTRAKQFLGEQRVRYNWVDIDRDDAARAYVQQVNDGKQIIPTIVFEDGSLLVEPSNAELAAKLGIEPKARRDFYDLIVIGGGPAGLSTALYAAREGIDALVIEQSAIGGQAGVTERIDNYLGFPDGVEGARLADDMRAHAERFGAEMLPAQTVRELRSDGDYRTVITESGDEYGAMALLLAVGTRYRRLNVPGEEDFIGAGIHFCATCDGPFYKDSDMVVIGGGNSALEEGLFLTRFADKITLLVRGDKLRASSVLQEKAANHAKMTIRYNTTVQQFTGDGRLDGVVVKDAISGQAEELNPAAVFVFIGLDPNTGFVADTVELDEWGFIRTFDNMQTSVPGIFAAGDARAGSTKQVASAVGEGAAAALMIRQYLERLGNRRGGRGD